MNPRAILASGRPAWTGPLTEALRGVGLAAQHLDWPSVTVDESKEQALFDWLDHQMPFRALLLAPPSVVEGVSGLEETLAASFAIAKAAAVVFERHSARGHLVALLPGADAMGDSGSAIDAAVAGAVLSLFRTMAMEFKSLNVSVNALMLESEPTADLLADAMPVLAALVAQEDAGITGQQLFATHGADVGRLRP